MSDSNPLFYRIATAVVVVVAAAGLYVAGSPGQARLLRLDERRVIALQQARTEIEQFHSAHDSLPDLARLRENINYDSTWFQDVETGKPYEYHIVTDSTFQLCAEFARSSREGAQFWDASWGHPAGRHCFDFRIKDGSSTLTKP